MGALITRGGLAFCAAINNGFPAAAVSLQINGVFHLIPDHVPVILLEEQGRPFQAYADRRQLRVSKRMRPRCAALYSGTNRDFILRRRHPLNIGLRLGAGTVFPHHAGEVFRPVSVQQRRTIQKDILPGQFTGKFPFTKGDQQFCFGNGL